MKNVRTPQGGIFLTHTVHTQDIPRSSVSFMPIAYQYVNILKYVICHSSHCGYYRSQITCPKYSTYSQLSSVNLITSPLVNCTLFYADALSVLCVTCGGYTAAVFFNVFPQTQQQAVAVLANTISIQS